MEAPDKSEEAAEARANFYAEALNESERMMLEAAASVEGLAEEVAALRVRLATALQDHPEDLKLALYGMNTLLRMVVAQYRLSPRASKELAGHLTALLNDLGDHILSADR